METPKRPKSNTIMVACGMVLEIGSRNKKILAGTCKLNVLIENSDPELK